MKHYRDYYYPCFNFDHKHPTEIKKRRKINSDITKLFHSTKIKTNRTLINMFTKFRYENTDEIDKINQDLTRRDNSSNIHRIECPECNTLFDELKISSNIVDKAFMKELNDLIGLSEDYHVKGYLTWSSSHNINPPSITPLNVNEENLPYTCLLYTSPSPRD